MGEFSFTHGQSPWNSALRVIRKVLLDIAREEKTHVGEFQTLLLIEDREQGQALEEGKKEIQELLTQKKRY
jgi:rubrerythrin